VVGKENEEDPAAMERVEVSAEKAPLSACSAWASVSFSISSYQMKLAFAHTSSERQRVKVLAGPRGM
jgi:hypothetical protein